MVKYDDMSASWQQGYDDFYDTVDYDESERGFPEQPEWADTVEYCDGWDHANYENAYEGHKLAKGGPQG